MATAMDAGMNVDLDAAARADADADAKDAEPGADEDRAPRPEAAARPQRGGPEARAKAAAEDAPAEDVAAAAANGDTVKAEALLRIVEEHEKGIRRTSGRKRKQPTIYGIDDEFTRAEEAEEARREEARREEALRDAKRPKKAKGATKRRPSKKTANANRQPAETTEDALPVKVKATPENDSRRLSRRPNKVANGDTEDAKASPLVEATLKDNSRRHSRRSRKASRRSTTVADGNSQDEKSQDGTNEKAVRRPSRKRARPVNREMPNIALTVDEELGLPDERVARPRKRKTVGPRSSQRNKIEKTVAFSNPEEVTISNPEEVTIVSLDQVVATDPARKDPKGSKPSRPIEDKEPLALYQPVEAGPSANGSLDQVVAKTPADKEPEMLKPSPPIKDKEPLTPSQAEGAVPSAIGSLNQVAVDATAPQGTGVSEASPPIEVEGSLALSESKSEESAPPATGSLDDKVQPLSREVEEGSRPIETEKTLVEKAQAAETEGAPNEKTRSRLRVAGAGRPRGRPRRHPITVALDEQQDEPVTHINDNGGNAGATGNASSSAPAETASATPSPTRDGKENKRAQAVGSDPPASEQEPVTEHESLAAMARKLEEDPLMCRMRPCEASGHIRIKRARKPNCSSNPNCLIGLGEGTGIHGPKFRISTLLGPDPRLNSRRAADGTTLKHVPVGLINLGATCYVNALIQTLFMIPRFRYRMLNWGLSTVADNAVGLAPMKELQRVFALMQEGDAKVQDLRKLVSLLEIDTSYQQDAQEFNKLFLALIDALAAKGPEQSHGSSLGNMFRGSVDNTTTCLKCGIPSVRPEDLQEIQVNIKGHSTLVSALNALGAVETLEGGNQYECSHCKSKQDAKRAVRIAKLPEVLVLQLNRSYWDAKAGTRKKVRDSIEIPESLDFVEEEPLRALLNESLREGIDTDKYFESNHAYSLTAVLAHRGTSANAGHYTADVLDVMQDPHVWYNMDDVKVSTIDRRPTASSNAYMLVYRRTSALRKDNKNLATIPAELRAVVQAANAELDADIETYERHAAEIKGQIAKRQEICERLSGDAKDGSSTAVDVGEGVWVPAEWLRAYISGQAPPAASSKASAKPVRQKASSASDEAVDLSGDSNIPCETVDLCEDNDTATASGEGDDVGGQAVEDASATTAVLFSSPPDVRPFLCQHSNLATNRACISPGSASKLKRIRSTVWDEIADSCGIPPDSARDLPYVLDEATHKDLACPECVGKLHKRMRHLQVSKEARERIEFILRSSRVSSARTNENREDYLYISNAWANDWLRYNKEMQEQAAAMGQVSPSKSSALPGQRPGPGRPRRARIGRPAKGSRKKCLEAPEVLEALTSLGGAKEPATNINAGITCPHGHLTMGNRDKQLLYAGDWDFLLRNALGGRCKKDTRVFGATAEACPECEASDQFTKNQVGELALRKSMQIKDGSTAKALRSLSKRKHMGRPLASKGVLAAGTYFLVPRGWLVRWRNFVTNRADPNDPDGLDKTMRGPEVMCPHDKRIIPPRLLHWLRRDGTPESQSPLTPEEREHSRVSSDLVEVISKAEWEGLAEFYGGGALQPFRLILDEDLDLDAAHLEGEVPQDRFRFDPPLCQECMDARIKNAAREASVYEGRRIAVVILPKTPPSAIAPPAADTEDMDDVECVDDAPGPASPHSSSSSQSAPPSGTVKTAATSAGRTRRSKRANDSSVKKGYIDVSSTMTLANMMVLAYYNENLMATLNELDPDWVEVYHRGKRLEDLSLTLEVAGIRADDEVFLKISKSTTDDPTFDAQARWYELLQSSTEGPQALCDGKDPGRVRERGFEGSLLSRANV